MTTQEGDKADHNNCNRKIKQRNETETEMKK